MAACNKGVMASLSQAQKTPIRVLPKTFFALGWIYGYQTNQYGPQSSQKNFERNRIKNKPSRSQNVRSEACRDVQFLRFLGSEMPNFYQIDPIIGLYD